MHYLSSVAFTRLSDPVGLRSMVIPEVPPRVNLSATKYDLAGDGSRPESPSAWPDSRALRPACSLEQCSFQRVVCRKGIQRHVDRGCSSHCQIVCNNVAQHVTRRTGVALQRKN